MWLKGNEIMQTMNGYEAVVKHLFDEKKER